MPTDDETLKSVDEFIEDSKNKLDQDNEKDSEFNRDKEILYHIKHRYEEEERRFQTVDSKISSMSLKRIFYSILFKTEFAVKNGGTKLDSYDGNYWFYRKCGFEPISYCEFVEDFAPDDWKKGHAFNSKEFKKENIIFFKHTGKQSKYVDENEFYDNVDVSKDYDDAEHIRDKQFTRINKVKSWLKNIR